MSRKLVLASKQSHLYPESGKNIPIIYIFVYLCVFINEIRYGKVERKKVVSVSTDGSIK
jgi:hypothetical protein